MNCDVWGVSWGAVKSVRTPTGKGLLAGAPPMFYRAPVRAAIFGVVLVFVELRGESGLWLADQIRLGSKRCLTAVANHTERLMRIDRRMSLQAGATDVWCACGRGSLTVFT